MMSIFSFDFADILGAIIKTSNFFLNIMHKVKAERWRVVCQEHAYFTASLDLEIAD